MKVSEKIDRLKFGDTAWGDTVWIKGKVLEKDTTDTEPRDEKVEVPDYIAKLIRKYKAKKETLVCSIANLYRESDEYKWYVDNAEIYERAWVNGYEVEEEPKWKIINDQKYCLTSIEAGYGNSLHWAFDSTKKKPILFDNEETALYIAYITGGKAKKV